MDAKLIVIGGKANKSEIKLKLPTTIGRSRTADLTVAHPKVSRQHCQIYEREGALIVRDNSSLNGTFIENQRVTEAVLKPGDKLTVGPLTFVAVYSHVGEFPILDSPGQQLPQIASMDSTSGNSIFVPVSPAEIAAKAAAKASPKKTTAKVGRTVDLPETPKLPEAPVASQPQPALAQPDVAAALLDGDSGDLEDAAWLAVLEQSSRSDAKTPVPAPVQPAPHQALPEVDEAPAENPQLPADTSTPAEAMPMDGDAATADVSSEADVARWLDAGPQAAESIPEVASPSHDVPHPETADDKVAIGASAMQESPQPPANMDAIPDSEDLVFPELTARSAPSQLPAEAAMTAEVETAASAAEDSAGSAGTAEKKKGWFRFGGKRASTIKPDPKPAPPTSKVPAQAPAMFIAPPVEEANSEVPTVPELSPEASAEEDAQRDPALDAFFKGLN